MTLENYYHIGPALGSNFQRILFEMSAASVDASFLVFGYDNQKMPHIFTVKEKGEVEYFDMSGFWASGSGQTAALGALSSKNHSRFNSYKRVLLNMCEAKFAAEAAPGVGQESFVVVVHPDGSHFTLYNIGLMRKAYERARRKPVTKSQMNAVEALLKNLTAERGPQREVEEAKPAKQLPESTRSPSKPKLDVPIQ
jgi:20S proteasome alpha/beta subunit